MPSLQTSTSREIRQDTEITRISFNVTPETVRSIRELSESENVSAAEALRRLIAYGKLMYETSKDENKTMLIRENDGTANEIFLL